MPGTDKGTHDLHRNTKDAFGLYAMCVPGLVLALAILVAFALRILERVLGADLAAAIGWADLLLIVTGVSAIGYSPFALAVAWWAYRRAASVPRLLVWVAPLAIALVLGALDLLALGMIRPGRRPEPVLVWMVGVAVVGYGYVLIAELTFRLRR